MNKKLETPVVVVIFSFGSKGTKGNKLLAVAGAKEAKGAYVVVTQRDIPRIESVNSWYYVEDFKLTSGWHSSLWVATSAREICECRKFPRTAIVVAVPMHLKRCSRDLKRNGFKVVKTVSPKLTSSNNWYEKESLLPWTRSWWMWWPREIILRLLPWSVYKWLTLREK